MTTIGHERVDCAVCGESSSHPFIASTNTFGSPDLDLRPPPMKRSTITYWLQQCPHCGFVANQIDEAEEAEITLWREPGFQLARADIADADLIGRFRTRALIDERLGRFDAAARNMLCAAWAADDQDNDASVDLRSRAADMLMDALPGAGADETIPMRTQLIDILRRAGRWNEAMTVANEVLAADIANETIRHVAQFGKARAEAHDDACYSIEAALPDAGN